MILIVRNVILLLVLATIFIGIPVGIIILQVCLSKKDSRWPGLIMPIIFVCMSLIIIFSMAVYSNIQTTSREIMFAERYEFEYDRLAELREMEPMAPEHAQRIAEMESMAQERIDIMRYHGEIIEHHEPGRIVSIGRILFMFLMLNIPTAILLAIYASCRGKRRQQRAVEMMSLQDLG